MKPNEQKQAAKQKFLDEMSMLFEGFGLPNHAGRMMAWLLICTPGEQTSEDMARNLMISKASISLSTRLLENWGMIDKFKKPSTRGYFYRIKKNVWVGVLQRKLQGMYVIKDLVTKASSDFGDTDLSIKRRLREVESIYSFIIVEFEKIFSKTKDEMSKGEQ